MCGRGQARANKGERGSHLVMIRDGIRWNVLPASLTPNNPLRAPLHLMFLDPVRSVNIPTSKTTRYRLRQRVLAFQLDGALVNAGLSSAEELDRIGVVVRDGPVVRALAVDVLVLNERGVRLQPVPLVVPLPHKCVSGVNKARGIYTRVNKERCCWFEQRAAPWMTFARPHTPTRGKLAPSPRVAPRWSDLPAPSCSAPPC